MFQFNNVINNHYSFSQKLSDEIQLTLKVKCKEVKTQQVDRNNVVNLTTGFGLLGGNHQVQQAIGDNISYGFKSLDVEISSSILYGNIQRKKL